MGSGAYAHCRQWKWTTASQTFTDYDVFIATNGTYRIQFAREYRN